MLVRTFAEFSPLFLGCLEIKINVCIIKMQAGGAAACNNKFFVLYK